jgi:hypothetical protein
MSDEEPNIPERTPRTSTKTRRAVHSALGGNIREFLPTIVFDRKESKRVVEAVKNKNTKKAVRLPAISLPLRNSTADSKLSFQRKYEVLLPGIRKVPGEAGTLYLIKIYFDSTQYKTITIQQATTAKECAAVIAARLGITQFNFSLYAIRDRLG